jgi:hypothetical protein
MSLKEPDSPNQGFRALEDAILAPHAAVLPCVTPSPETEEEWAEAIRHDLATGIASYINAGRKFIQAKTALKKTNGSFIHLVTVLLGYDLDTAERWMEIARHPVLSDSATLRNLPTAWTTLYQLSHVPPKLLLKYIADGTVHPQLTCRAAAQLLKGGSNGGRNPDDDAAGDGDADRGRGGDHGGDHQRVDDRKNHDADPAGNVPAAEITNNTIGPNSQGELERKLARLEELERETRRQAIQLVGYESEVQELKAKLGPETPIRSQRKLFQQALRALQKSEVPGTLAKEIRFLKQSATTGLVELVRSAVNGSIWCIALSCTDAPQRDSRRSRLPRVS